MLRFGRGRHRFDGSDHRRAGTGKELSPSRSTTDPRKIPVFVKVKCAALRRVDERMFGHEKRACTGAISRKLGRFERPTAGRLPRRVGDLPLYLQAKCFVCAGREFEASAHADLKVNARVIERPTGF